MVDDDFKIYEKLIHVASTDANTLASLIQDCLIRFSLPISQYRGQAYDGAANMSGYISGVAARIQRIEHFSPKRCTLFEAFQAEMTPGAPTLKPLCPTRWTVRTKAIDSVLRKYSVC